MSKVIAYGLRKTQTGRYSVVVVAETAEVVRYCDFVGTRCVRLHSSVGTYGSCERAIERAKKLAEQDGVPYVGFKADML